ncbi:hypothetical protein FRC06_007932, partial [Ceratobasidium sp. 370]
MASAPDITKELSTLRDLLGRLPAKATPPGFAYPFPAFAVDEEWLEITGTVQGSVNHSLEVAFGSRASGNPIEFRSHGPDLVAVVDVLSSAITGNDGENVILLKWVTDLQNAARHVLAPVIVVDEAPTEASNEAKRVRKSTPKRALMEQDMQEKEDAKKKKTEAKEHTEKMKRRTQGTFTFDPQDLQDRVVVQSSKGPKPDPLFDLLAIYCVVISNPSNSNTTHRPAPTVRFRDFSDIATPIPKTPVTPVGKDKALGGGKVDGGGEESLMRDDLPDLWESNAGLDEEIE